MRIIYNPNELDGNGIGKNNKPRKLYLFKLCVLLRIVCPLPEN